jgi:signal recognition particle subunit SRP54
LFENLSDKLNTVFKTLKGHGKLTEGNIKSTLREVRLALLEADVNFKVVKVFVDEIMQKAMGEKVLHSLTPAQQLIKIINEELIHIMGDVNSELDLKAVPPVGIMLVGLQGSGKTTTAGKLANHLRKHGKKPFMVPADVYRPAAIEQLKILGKQLNIEVFDSKPNENPVNICKAAKQYALVNGYDTYILDTAGRLHVDEKLMGELKNIKSAIVPNEILFVADAMTGQESVNIAQTFNDTLDITGVILTKMDGDARGGAALSIKHITKKPIKFVGVGEKLNQFEVFHPDRMASRILGMGDMLSFIEKAQSVFDEKKALDLEKKIRKNEFTLEDFRDQLIQMTKMGSLESIMKMVPGFSKIKNSMINIKSGENELKKTIAIINSMTVKERKRCDILNGSRRKRIALGSGTTVTDVNRTMKKFMETRKMIQKVSKIGMKGLSRLKLPF